ncbi:MAG TPA: MASE1 domain-containing protein [Candidatus Omnitrophota bacterium]|nr:MASE1 domain-containing protein [Candidatus Omnitrophota bacterium]
MNDQAERSASPRIFTDAVLIALLAAAYFFAGKFGLSLAIVHKSATAVWPPTGLALAALLILGYRVWPGVLIGAFFVNLLTAGNLWTSFGIAVGNTLEPLVGAYLVNRYAHGWQAFERPRNICLFVLLAAMISTTISATVGVTSLSLGGFASWADFSAIWFTWWLGDKVSALTIAPILLVWTRRPFPKFSLKRAAEFLILFIITCLVGRIIFCGWVPFDVKNYPMPYFVMPLIIWSAFRFNQRGTTLIIFTLNAFALYGTIHGSGPFAIRTPYESLLLLQTYMATIGITALVLAALVSERERIQDELIRTNENLNKEILARQKAQEIIVQYNERVTQSNKELDHFASIASHDLQEPLAKIVLFGDRLKTLLAARPVTQETDYLDRMQNAAIRMKNLLEGLLAYSRATTVKSDRDEVPLGRIVNEVIDDLEVRIVRSKARIEVGDLPTVTGHALQIHQLFQNLIANAIKFSEKKGVPQIEIYSKKDPQGKWVEISVRDNGIGFDEKYTDRIFELFQRLGDGHEYEGSGVGLAICQKIMRQHDGQILAQSKPGEGATFTVRFPRETASL